MQLATEGVPGSGTAIQRRAAMHYHGQIYELTVAVPDGPIGPAGVHALEEAFGREHERTYGHRAGAEEPVELVSVQLIASAADAEPPRLPDAERLPGQDGPAPPGARAAYFGPERGWLETPVLCRRALAQARTGPCIPACVRTRRLRSSFVARSRSETTWRSRSLRGDSVSRCSGAS